jgi:hypothetical protein
MDLSRGRIALAAPPLLALAVFGLMGVPARAGDHHKQYVYLQPAQAPVVMAPQVTYTAQAPVAYTAQAPMAYTAQAPVAYTAQAPVAYTAQAPMAYTMAASSTMAVGAAPVGAAPDETNRIRLSTAIRHALFADLVALYHSQESGTARLDKIEAVRDRAREGYERFISDSLNPAEEEDLDRIVEAVITQGYGGGSEGYPPFQAPAGVGYQYRSQPYPAPTVFLAPAPRPTVLVPVVRAHPRHGHHLFKD